jgi:DNA-binding transcriptional MerR regulator
VLYWVSLFFMRKASTSQQTVTDILFIKRAQEVGFTLEEIKNLLILYKKDEELPTQEMNQLALAKVEEIKKKISQLQHFKALPAVTMDGKVVDMGKS